MNVLLINAHQHYEGFSEGKLNQLMLDTAEKTMLEHGHEVQVTSIETGYDIQHEVEKHLWADLIITQSPVYWFATPWIYKKYVDEVFTAGLVDGSIVVDDGRTREDPNKQYGTGGKMQSKKYMLSLTWNAPKAAFEDKTQGLYEGKSVDDAFIHNTVNYKFCGAEVLPSFSCFDVMKNPNIENDVERFQRHLHHVLQ